MRSEKPIREIGGEFWVELRSRIPEDAVAFDVKNEIVEILMGVLARHEDSVIVNDEGLEVAPLPVDDDPST